MASAWSPKVTFTILRLDAGLLARAIPIAAVENCVLKEHDRLMQAVLADVLNQRSTPASFKQWKHVGEGMELVISSSSRNSAKRS